MQHYLKYSLQGQESSKIRQPMNPDCKVAVLIPVFNEDLEIFLTPLLSLVNQIAVNKNEYEVIMVINNDKKAAQEKSAAFLQNQKCLEVISYLNSSVDFLPFAVTEEQKKKIQKIKDSGLVVFAIDKSTLENAEDYNNVGVAKDRGGAEICHRFLSVPAVEQGIIVLTDCDCWFSENSLAYIMATYQEFKLNGLSGTLLNVAPAELANGELVLQCLRLQRGQSPQRPDRPADRIFLQKQQNLNRPLLTDSQNITVTVGAWLAVDGMPHFASWENRPFMDKIMALEGEIGRNTGYTVYTYARPSQRAGLSSFGRRVYEIEMAIQNYKSGKANKVLIPDEQKSTKFLGDFFRSCLDAKFSNQQLVELMNRYEFLPNALLQAELDLLITEYRREIALPIAKRRFDVFEQLVFKYLYPYFPKMDITSRVI